MSETQIYIGDDIVDSNKTVSINIKRIDIGDLSLRWVNYAKRLKILLTENNKRIFGYADDEHSASTKPYRYLSGKIVQSGIEIMPQANIVIDGYDGNYGINIYENIIDYFSSIKGKLLSEISPISNSAWTAAGIDAARTNTSGIVSAIINWGKPGGLYQVNYFLPSFYYHSIITAILEYTGLTISGSILTDTRFTELVIPYPGDKFEYD